MTKRKTLKQRVRERQQKTGERYTTALAHVQAHRDGEPGSGEPLDVTRLARAAGLACTASASPNLARGTASERERRVRIGLDALKGLLLALAGDSGAAKMADVLLRAEAGPPVSANGIAEAVEARSFMQSVARGRRTLVATVLWQAPTRPAFLYLAALGEGASGPWTTSFALAGIGGWSAQ
jgi:hypothetical protein